MAAARKRRRLIEGENVGLDHLDVVEALGDFLQDGNQAAVQLYCGD